MQNYLIEDYKQEKRDRGLKKEQFCRKKNIENEIIYNLCMRRIRSARKARKARKSINSRKTRKQRK